MSLHPVSPMEGESEVNGASITTRGTTPGVDENNVPLPVVRGVIQSASRACPRPYCVPATTGHLHVDSSIVRCPALLRGSTQFVQYAILKPHGTTAFESEIVGTQRKSSQCIGIPPPTLRCKRFAALCDRDGVLQSSSHASRVALYSL